jgi:predicted transcriptional regulator of viral defense system
MLNKLERAKVMIRGYLDSYPGGVFTDADVLKILNGNRRKWDLGTSVSDQAFSRFLVEQLGLRVVDLLSEEYRSLQRYGWQDFSPYLMALSIRPRAYLSHGTAVFLHGLNDQIPKTIYVNQEQSEKPRGGGLTQENLNLAFSRRQRTSRHIYSFDSYRAVLLSGKYTAAYGVVARRGPKREELPVTNIARTLVDIAVRPAYAGGIVQVLEAFRGARGRVKGIDLVRVLRRLNHVYPYHQAIGFLMERAGHPAEEWQKLRHLGAKYDFYLLHGMRGAVYDPKWRLFFPEGF